MSEWIVPVICEVVQERKAIAGLLRETRERMKGRHIAITGMPGAGKTVLLEHLSGSAYVAGYKPPGASGSVERAKISGKSRIIASTIPGQDTYIRLGAIDRLLKSRRAVDGVIHVVNYGYSVLRETSAADILIQSHGISTIDMMRQYFMAEELKDLKATLDVLRSTIHKKKKPQWLIVAATKADLFADQLTDAAKYYSIESGNSEFVDCLRKFQGQIGSDNIIIETRPVAASLENLVWNGETVKSQLLPNARDNFILNLSKAVEDKCGV
ncbi:MAG TPA: GTPase [Capsulimonadaceae bacterium]|jgi:GTPase SAR1 family protein